jgi:hypothetical protein
MQVGVRVLLRCLTLVNVKKTAGEVGADDVGGDEPVQVAGGPLIVSRSLSLCCALNPADYRQPYVVDRASCHDI